ncbi:MAG: DsbA family protein [Candidatus Pacebacteria bacterium]|nr:DsbA family protein [Candidatus Paceibacterota bacterium]
MKSQYVLPITIVVAGLLIAGAVFLLGGDGGGATTDSQNIKGRAFDPSKDYIVGNPDAPIKVVEYADLECPFCKTFHNTMHQVMQYYGPGGQVAWVFRPFPLAQLHSKAPREAQAAECAGEQGGSEAFFKFIDRLYEVTPSSNGLDLNQLPVIAGEVGLDTNAFNSCLASEKYAKKVSESYAEAIKLGAQGTPYTLIMVGDEAVTLPGNQPYDSMRAAIDAVLVGVNAPAATEETPAQ